MGTVVCKDSNKDDWIYVIRTGCCRVIKALTQVTPILTLKKTPEIIYDRFGMLLIRFIYTRNMTLWSFFLGEKIQSPYSKEAIGVRSQVRLFQLFLFYVIEVF